MGSPGPTQANLRSDRVPYEFPQRSVGPCRGGNHPDRSGASAAAGQGVLRRLIAAIMRFEDSPAGDRFGLVVLIVVLVALLSQGGF